MTNEQTYMKDSIDREIDRDKMKSYGTSISGPEEVYDTQMISKFRSNLESITRNSDNEGKGKDSGLALNKKVAGILGYSPKNIEEKFVDILHKCGFDNYQRNINNLITDMKKTRSVVEHDIDSVKRELEGSGKQYVPLKTGSEAEFRERKSVPKSAKGLLYMMEETDDYVAFTNGVIVQCNQKVTAYDMKVAELDGDLQSLKQDTRSPENLSRIRSLTREVAVSNKKKDNLEREIAKLTNTMVLHNNKFEAYKLKVLEKEDVLELAEHKLGEMQLGIDIIETYQSVNGSEDVSVRKLIDDLKILGRRTENVSTAVAAYQAALNEGREEIKSMSGGNGVTIINNDYSNGVAEDKAERRLKNEEIRISIAKRRGLE